MGKPEKDKKASPSPPKPNPKLDGGKIEYDRARALQKAGKEDPSKLDEALEAYTHATTLPGCPHNAYYYLAWLQCKINCYDRGSETAIKPTQCS